VVGLILKEWKQVSRKTYAVLIVALIVLISSFVIMTWGSVKGEESATATATTNTASVPIN